MSRVAHWITAQFGGSYQKNSPNQSTIPCRSYHQVRSFFQRLGGIPKKRNSPCVWGRIVMCFGGTYPPLNPSGGIWSFSLELVEGVDDVGAMRSCQVVHDATVTVSNSMRSEEVEAQNPWGRFFPNKMKTNRKETENVWTCRDHYMGPIWRIKQCTCMGIVWRGSRFSPSP